MSPRSATAELLRRHWLVGGIGVAVLAGILLPAAGQALPRYHLTDAGVVLVMLLGSLRLSAERFRQAFGQLRLVLLSLPAIFLLAPALSLLAAMLLGLDGPSDRVAVLISSAQAMTLASAIILTEIAGGDVALAMVISLVANLASVLLTPLAFGIFSGVDVSFDPGSMMLELAVKVVLPVAAGQVLRLFVSDFAQRHGRKLAVVSQLVILTYIWSGVAIATVRLSGRGEVLPRVLAVVVLWHFALLLANALWARLATRDPARRAALVLCCSQKTLPVAILIWQNHFASLPLGPLVAVTNHVVQLSVDSLIAPRLLQLPLVRRVASSPLPRAPDRQH